MALATFKTSMIFVATARGTEVYRSPDEIPESLRQYLSQESPGMGSATILIADRNGQEELARAIQGLPSSVQLRVLARTPKQQEEPPAKPMAGLPRLWLYPGVAAVIGLLAWGVPARQINLQISSTSVEMTDVERTHDVRLEPGQGIWLSLMEAEGKKLPATIESRTGARIVVRCSDPVAIEAPVRMDLDDSLLLAQISDCERKGNAFSLTVDIVHAIPSLSDLAKLVAAVMSEGRATSPSTARSAAAVAGERHWERRE